MTTPSGRVLTVGSGQQFASLNAALAVSQDGDVIAVAAGTYTNDISTVTHSVTIEGVGGLAHFQSTGNIANGKAILIDDAANLTLENLEFSGAQVAEGNGAAIRYEAGNLVVKNSYFHDNQDGILGGAITGGNVTIDGSTFTHNGAGDGQTHAVYLGTINRLQVTNSFFQDQIGGSDVKSRAAYTDVENNRFIDTAAGTTNYQVDLPNGGNDTIAGNTILKSANAENRAVFHFGGELANATGNLTVHDNQVYSDRDPTVLVLNQTTGGQPVSIANNGLETDTVSIMVDGTTAGTSVSGTSTLDGSHAPSTALVLPTALATGITLGASDAPPVLSVPANQTVVAGSTLALHGVAIADPDGATQSYTVTLSAIDGTLSTSGGAGTIAGNGTSAMTITGSLANANADLAALGFKGTALGAGSLQIKADDGHNGIDTESVAVTVTAPGAQAPSGRVLTVGASGQEFTSLNSALAVSQDGDVIQVQAGTYTNDISTVTHSVTIEGVGGLAHFQSTGMIANDKAILIDDAANLTIQNLEFSGAQVWDGNGAGIRYEAGNLVVKNSYFHDDQDGILGGAITGGNVTIDGSTFTHDGAGDGQTHAVYLGTINKLTVTNSFFQDQIDGSDIKSRATYTDVENDKFIDHSGATTNYEVDLPNGGNATVSGSVVVKGAYADNSAIVHFGGELANATGNLLIQNNQFYGERDPTNALLNQTTTANIQILNNGWTPTTMYNFVAGNTAGVTVSGSTVLNVNAPPAPDLVLPTILSTNAAPVTSVPGTLSVVDGATVAVAGLGIADPDGAAQSYVVTLTATGGTVSTGGSAGTITGNGTGSLTLAGSLANVNSDLAAIGFKGNAIGAGALKIVTSDGAGGSDSHTVGVTVTDAAPITTVPGTQNALVGSKLALTGIHIADADGASQNFTVSLTGLDGTVATTGTVGTIAGNGTGHLTLSGTLANVNTDLAALSFTGTAAGAGSLQVQTSDGAGSSDSHTVAINVTAPTPHTLMVGAGQTYSSLTAALAVAHDGDTIMLQAGTYTMGRATITSAVTIEGVNGTAHLVANGAISNGVGFLTTTANVTLANLDISGVTSKQHNTTAINSTAGNLTLTNVSVENSDSALWASGSNATVEVSNSDFGHNGGGTSPVINVGAVTLFQLENSKVHDTVGVTEVRSLAATTGLGHDQLIDGTGNPLYALDLPNVGNVVVGYTVMSRGAGALDPSLIHLGGGVTNPAGYLTVHDSTFTSAMSTTHALYNQALYNTVGFQNDGVGANITQVAIGQTPYYANDYVVTA